MGLSVTAWPSATPVPPHATNGTWCDNDDHVQAYIIAPEFHRSLRGLKADRCYKVGGEEAHVDNSYGGHNRFREQLARVFLGKWPRNVWDFPDRYADKPFFELIHFADNEGAIGPDAAGDLYVDFCAGRQLWVERCGDEWLRQAYDEWTEVCRVGATGLVRFA